MFPRFVAVPQEVTRSGLLPKLKEGEIRLYWALMDRTEYCSTREFTLTDEQIRKLSGAAPRTLCNARKKLQELGLIQYRRTGGNKYNYVICDPATGKPYPGGPKEKVAYQKRTDASRSELPLKPELRSVQPSPKQDAPPEAFGIPLNNW